jgi:tRNA nucleotidyltransferase/poly(A) polymerase
MLRGVQFASRFGFGFVDSTWRMIQDNAEDINHITGERVLTELDKIFTKGDLLKGLIILKNSGLASELFPNFREGELDRVNFSETRADFFSFLVKDGNEFKTTLKGDSDTADGIDAINIVRDSLEMRNNHINKKSTSELRHIVFNAQKKSSTVLESGLLNSSETLASVLSEFSNGVMPRSAKELQLNGHDLMSLGLKGREIGEAQIRMLDSVFTENVVNTKESLLTLF